MGCSASRLEDEEAVRLCKDRRNFIKQAVEQRIRFATGHIAYIQALKRVSLALREYVEGDGHYDMFSDSYTTPPFTPVKRLSPEIIGIPFKSSTSTSTQTVQTTLHVARYLRSGGNASVSVEEWPQSPETVRVNSYYNTDNYGMDGFFASQAPTLDPAFLTPPYTRPSYPPPSPQNSQWDSFWNPFSSLDDAYGYPYQSSFNRVINYDDMAGLRQVREEEGIPDLEEEPKEEEDFLEVQINDRRTGEVKSNCATTKDADGESSEVKLKPTTTQEVKGFQSKVAESVQISESQNAVELEVTKEKEVARKMETAEQAPGFTVYLNRRPASMAEIIRDIENLFMRICDCAQEISVMLEASRAQYSTPSSDITVKMLNPVALFRTASSRSTSSRFFLASTSSRYDGYESSSDCSDDSCMISGSHQSTLDRLYAWEKKLFEEVKAGERTRIAFEKKCMQLKNQDVNGEEPSAVSKTRAALRDLHTRLKVSIHSVESISKRIETLRDEELQPQLLELVHGLARMWRTTAECHRLQKRAIDEAKLLVLASSSKAAGKPSELPEAASPHTLRAAAVLESELRSWRACLGAWVAAQRSYARSLAGWILRCYADPESGARSPLSPRRSAGGPPPVLGICIQWSQLLESVGEAQVLDGLDFFAAGMATVSGRAEGGASPGPSPAKRTAEEEETEKEAAVTAEMAGRVLCAGMSVAVSSLTDFAVRSADGYDLLVKRTNGDSGRGVEQ